MQLAPENCVLLHFGAENFLLENVKDIFLQNAFCFKSDQKMQVAFENCVLLHFVLKTAF